MEGRVQYEEVLEISYFGGIKEARFEIKPITVLIGPQASGKSVVAKLLYFFREFWLDAYDASQAFADVDAILQKFKQKFSELFPPGTWPVSEFTIKYHIEKESISIIRKERDSLDVHLSTEMQKWVESIVQDFVDNINKRRWNDFDYFLVWSKKVFPAKHSSNLLLPRYNTFIPASRGILYLIDKLKFSLLRSRNIIDRFLLSFGSSYDSARNEKLLNAYSLETNPHLNATSFTSLIQQILQGKYVPTKNEDFLEVADGRIVPMHFASSGQQESLPLLVVLEELAGNYNDHEPHALYVEEPEAHLFPASQRAMVELLAQFFNASAPGSNLIITTHSPYVLTVLDNLIKAGELSSTLEDQGKLDQINQIVPPELQIRLNNVAAYSLANGTAASIIDQEVGLIAADPIDEVGEYIDKEFSQLIDVEYDF